MTWGGVVEAKLVGDEGREIDHGWMMVTMLVWASLFLARDLSPNRHPLHPIGNGV